jgi:hypothetical protein
LYSFDASAMIYLWDNYPIQNPNFDSMWQWFFGQVVQENFVISDVAIKEVKQKIWYPETYLQALCGGIFEGWVSVLILFLSLVLAFAADL